MTELTALFADLPETLKESVRGLGWSEPMPVQAKVIPLMREGRDLIVQARTGSGKTGAFGIPIIESTDPDDRDIQALVMLPTRELAGQVANELSVLGKPAGIAVLPVYGGVARQVRAQTELHRAVRTRLALSRHSLDQVLRLQVGLDREVVEVVRRNGVSVEAPVVQLLVVVKSEIHPNEPIRHGLTHLLLEEERERAA